MFSPNWATVVQAASGDIRRLSSVWRFSSIPITVDENTAEHSFWVALYAALIHQEFTSSDPSGTWFHRDLGELLLHALVHDVPECVTGDVVRVFKYSTPELKREVDRAEGILLQGLQPSLRSLSSGNPSKYVKAVVKCADFLSLYQFMTREVMRGNREIHPFFKRMIVDLGEMALKSTTIEVECSEPFDPSKLYSEMLSSARRVESGFL